MPKITTQADKLALLAKMEQDRRDLADAFGRAAAKAGAGRGWASTTALTAGAVAGCPPFLKKPLRAAAALALRKRLANVLNRRNTRRVSAPPLADDEIAQLARLMADLRGAAERATDPREVEQIRHQLDEQVRRLRELRAAQVPPAPAPGAQPGQAVFGPEADVTVRTRP